MYSPIHPSIHHLLILHSFLFFLPFIHPSFFSSNIYSFFLPTIIYPSFFQSIHHFFIHPSIYVYIIYLFFFISIHHYPSIIYSSIHLIFPSFHPSINQSTHPSVHPSVSLLSIINLSSPFIDPQLLQL